MFIIQLRQLPVEHQETALEVVAIAEGSEMIIGNEKEILRS